MGLTDAVNLKGTLEYSSFDITVSRYDLFIGSGTSVIEASAIGIPSIVGIENLTDPFTYGYLCDVCDYEFNMKGLDLPLLSISNLITDFSNMSKEDRLLLSERHRTCVEIFTNSACQSSMDSLKSLKMPTKKFKYNPFLYETSRAFDQLGRVLNKKHPYNIMYKIER